MQGDKSLLKEFHEGMYHKSLQNTLEEKHKLTSSIRDANPESSLISLMRHILRSRPNASTLAQCSLLSKGFTWAQIEASGIVA